MQIFFPYTVVIIISRSHYQFFIEHEIEIFAVHNPHQSPIYRASLCFTCGEFKEFRKFNIFCLDYFDHVWRHQGSA